MASSELVARLVAPVHREVSIYVRRYAPAAEEEVMDLVHEVLVTLLERDCRELRRWDPGRGRSLDSFVRLIARRRVARILSSRRWARPANDAPATGGASDDGLARRIEARRVLDRLHPVLASDARDQRLFELVFVEQADPAAVAQELGMTRPAVNAWTYRRRKQARELVA